MLARARLLGDRALLGCLCRSRSSCVSPEYLCFLVFDLAHHRCRLLLFFRCCRRRQLLMASGIGNRAELEAHGLDCIADVPELGKNLQVRYTAFCTV